jgi:hypothetical protein
MEASDVPKKDCLSQYDFRKLLVLVWINDNAESKVVSRKHNFLTMVEQELDDETPKKNDVCSNGGANRRSSSRQREQEEMVPETIEEQLG